MRAISAGRMRLFISATENRYPPSPSLSLARAGSFSLSLSTARSRFGVFFRLRLPRAPTLSPATTPFSRSRSSYYLLQCARRYFFALLLPLLLALFPPFTPPSPPRASTRAFEALSFFFLPRLFLPLPTLPPRFLSCASSRSRSSFAAARARLSLFVGAFLSLFLLYAHFPSSS